MKSFFLSLICGAFLGGCISANVVEPRACDSKTITFPGAPTNPGIQIPPVTQSFTLDVGEGKDLVTKVLLLDGQFTRTDGTDFGFLDEIMVSVASPNGGDDVVLWDSQHNSGTVLDVKGSDANLVDYIDENNKFTVVITLSTQQPPVNAWSLNVSLCVSAEADKTYP